MIYHSRIYMALLSFVFYSSCTGQNTTDHQKESVSSEEKDLSVIQGPNTIVRTIKQDRKGNIWIASWDGIFRYDGKVFINITSQVSSARFFSVLEDRKGNYWFSSVGSGVYYYDGLSFINFTTHDGLANDIVTNIYEDKKGNIWFSTSSGASRYDGQSFRTFTAEDGPPNNDVNSIFEDSTGKFWIATKGNTYQFDGQSFTPVTHDDKPFKNVRSLIEDRNGKIWLAGGEGLWVYKEKRFENISNQFTAFVYEDKTGNIWTSTDNANSKKIVNDLPGNNSPGSWTIARYKGNSLNSKVLPEIITTNEKMIFGILEAKDGSIWLGTLNGVRQFTRGGREHLLQRK